uniref:Thiolase C-terminal domain-containing protein n=1 Tax=Oryza glumipatula TaxID=40148 RepID=A0A0D9Z110_9ORYZ
MKANRHMELSHNFVKKFRMWKCRRSFAAVGVDPAVMGVGPVVSIAAAVKAAGLQIDDVDLFEINVAFASQYVYCCKKLGLDPTKVNVNGGAMALGESIGCYRYFLWYLSHSQTVDLVSIS